MALSDIYSISVRYQRSTRIDSDLSARSLRGLVYHGTAQNTLETISRQYDAGQKTYTVTGPYGSGKSTIALLLMGLLHHQQNIRAEAEAVLNSQSTSIDVVRDGLGTINNGWLQIRAVGGLSAPIDTFWQATIAALESHPNTQSVASQFAKHKVTTDEDLLAHWQFLLSEVKNKVDGVLIVADELGKTLERINNRNEQLHLFQEVAETLSRHETPMLFVGLLHQAFSEYAKERGAQLQEEWAKIQGRYSDISYSVSTDETVSLLANSIDRQTQVAPISSEASRQVAQLTALTKSDSKRQQQLVERLERCAPLHPMVALLLGPLSKRRFSQNERSTFSFLCSHENHSFQQFLANTTDSDALYRVTELWDYLEANLEHAILNSPDSHAWAESTDALLRAAQDVELTDLSFELLKAISLINLIGKAAGLFATKETLQAAVNTADLTDELALLESKSLIVFRKHQSSYVVFEGSDIDVPKLVAEQLEQLKESSQAIERLNISEHIVAKGHYHDFGVLRWANKRVLSSYAQLQPLASQKSVNGEYSTFILLLEDTGSQFLSEFTRKNSHLAIGKTNEQELIRSLAREVYAHELILADSKIGTQLKTDRTAKKELDARLLSAQQQLQNCLAHAFSAATWYINGKETSGMPLSTQASLMANRIFHKSLTIKNELVNRNKLSGTAVSARKKLLQKMLESSHEKNLGIEGFPPEMSMYMSCLKQTKVHDLSTDSDDWEFVNPTQDHDLERSIAVLFSDTDKTIAAHNGKMINLSLITKFWKEAPYGITEGVAPILLLAYLHSHGEVIAFYEKDLSGEFSFIAKIDIDYVLKLQKSPQDLAIRQIVKDKNSEQWLNALLPYVGTLSNKAVAKNYLSIATPLVTKMHNLPQWVKNASNFKVTSLEEAKLVRGVRDLILHANDPIALLKTDLPKYLTANGEALSKPEMVDKLQHCFSILTNHHEQMLKEITELVHSLFPETKEELQRMCQIVSNNSADLRLKAFARELNRSRDFGARSIESLIAVAIGRTMTSWNEAAVLSARQKVTDYAQNFMQVFKASDGTLDGERNSSTRTVALVLENDQGQLINFKREVKVADEAQVDSQVEKMELALQSLTDFERIEVLQRLLQKSLTAE